MLVVTLALLLGPAYLAQRAELAHVQALLDVDGPVDVSFRCTGPQWLADLGCNRPILRHFPNAFDRVDSVRLVGDKFTDADLGHLRPLTHLRRVEVLCCGSITNKAFDGLRLPELEHLSLAGAPIGNESLRFVVASPHLRDVDLTRTRVSSAVLAHFRSLCALETLRIDVVPLGGADLSGLEALTALRELYANYTGVGDGAMQHVAKAASLERLDLSDADITDSGLAALGALTSLRTLNIPGTRVAGPGLRSLGRLAKLRSMGLARTQVSDSGLSSLSALPALEYLDLSYTQVTDACIPCLLGIQTLKNVDLVDTGLSPEGVRRLRAARPELTVGWAGPKAN